MKITINGNSLKTKQTYVGNIQHLERKYNLTTFQTIDGTNYHIWKNSVAGDIVILLATTQQDEGTLLTLQKVFQVFLGILQIGYFKQIESFDGSSFGTDSVNSYTLTNVTTQRQEGYAALKVEVRSPSLLLFASEDGTADPQYGTGSAMAIGAIRYL